MKILWVIVLFGGVRVKIVKKIVAVITILSILFSLTGCSLKFSSFENLMRPPKLIGKYQGLQDAFEKTINRSFTLITPENGDLQSSFLTQDVDSDGVEEAFVFFALNDEPEIAKISYFEYLNEEWKHIATLDGLGNSVDKVIINDLNADGVSEIMIGWLLYSSKTNRAVSEYKLTADSFEQIATYPYTFFDILDVNGDGYYDMLTLAVDSSVPDALSAAARVYTFNQQTGSLSLHGETAMDGNISSYSSVSFETVQDNNLIYVESLKGLNESVTEVIYWDDESNKLVSPLFDIATQSTVLTWRNMNLTVYDVDGDKFLEIPTSVDMPGSVVTTTGKINSSSNVTSDNMPATKMYFTKWVKFRNDKLVPVQYSIINQSLGYMLNIKSTWVGKITVAGNDGQWDFYRWNASSASVGELLFSIYAYDNSDTESKNKYSGYQVLKSTSDKTYVSQISNAGLSFGINNDWLENNFILTDFGGLR